VCVAVYVAVHVAVCMLQCVLQCVHCSTCVVYCDMLRSLFLPLSPHGVCACVVCACVCMCVYECMYRCFFLGGGGCKCVEMWVDFCFLSFFSITLAQCVSVYVAVCFAVYVAVCEVAVHVAVCVLVCVLQCVWQCVQLQHMRGVLRCTWYVLQLHRGHGSKPKRGTNSISKGTKIVPVRGKIFLSPKMMNYQP